jgi:hypothetical protein
MFVNQRSQVAKYRQQLVFIKLGMCRFLRVTIIGWNRDGDIDGNRLRILYAELLQIFS